MLLREGRARSVAGFDLSAEAIGEARGRFQAPELEFAEADVTRLPVPDQSFDLYVSFETIEHLPDDRGFVAEAVRVLRPGGKFLCSTPNRRLFHPGATLHDRPVNPFHVREYNLQEYEALLREFFRHVEWYGQTRFPASYCGWLARLGKVSPLAAVRFHQFTKLGRLSWRGAAMHAPFPLRPGDHPEILIAVCS